MGQHAVSSRLACPCLRRLLTRLTRLLVESIQPNKSDALSYIDGDASPPPKWAKAILDMRAFEDPYYQEIMVGPLPVDNSTTTWAPLAYPLTKNSGGKVRNLEADSEKLYSEWIYPITSSIADMRQAYAELQAKVDEEAVLRACMFEHGRRIGLAVHGTLRIPRLRRLVFHVAMEHANWNTWVKFFGHVLESAEGLKELVIDWEPRRSPSAATRVGFMAQHETRMEKRLFKAVAGARNLESLRIHGDIPAHWAEELGNMLGDQVRMVWVRERWWLEDWESG